MLATLTAHKKQLRALNRRVYDTGIRYEHWIRVYKDVRSLVVEPGLIRANRAEVKLLLAKDPALVVCRAQVGNLDADYEKWANSNRKALRLYYDEMRGMAKAMAHDLRQRPPEATPICRVKGVVR